MRNFIPYLMGMTLLTMVGCETLDTVSQLGTSIAVATGDLTEEQAASINRSTHAVGKAFDQLTPQQEYYIGRAVAASILSSYKPYNNPRANHYINVIGQALAMASTKPETYGGYHFLIMDTNEINAFSAPGGFVMVSRGLLRCCQNETEVAAVLAHEIGHVENEHGLRAIKKSRWTSAFTILGTEAAKNLGTEELAELTKNFEGAINDVTATMVNSGYARKLEFEADASAVRIMEQIGYNPNGLRNMLREMAKRLGHDNRGFAKTHPSPADRISKIKAQLAVDKSLTPNATRAARFKKALRGI